MTHFAIVIRFSCNLDCLAYDKSIKVSDPRVDFELNFFFEPTDFREGNKDNVEKRRLFYILSERLSSLD